VCAAEPASSALQRPAGMPPLAPSPSDSDQKRTAAVSSFRTEFTLLLACCAVADHAASDADRQTLIERGIDWPRLIQLADHHGVTPLVYKALRGTESVPPSTLETLGNHYQHNARKNLQFTAELFRVLDCLDSHSIPAIPLKGPILAETVYRDLALRDFSDLDVLVRREHVLKAKTALETLGYAVNTQLSEAEERDYLATGYEYTFDGPAGRNLLEIQWDILPRFYAVKFDCCELFRRTQTVPVCGRTVRTLSPEDLLLTLCVHAGKHAWIRLCWLRDIAGAVQSQTVDWAGLERQARKLGVARIVGVSLRLAHRLLHANVPDLVRNLWNADPETERLSEEVLGGLPNAEAYNPESLQYFRLMMRLRERRSDQFRFLCRLALTPSVGEWRVIRLPAPLFPLYPVIRMFRLGARMLRSDRD
jgi:putative nucleotidyltransferase-like protein